MKFVVERNWIEIIGPIWWPSGATCAQRIDLSAYDVGNIEDIARERFGSDEVTREAVEYWLCTHAGDFQHVADFYAVVGEKEFNWKKDGSEFAYIDCMFRMED